ncbi:hypothetical protein ACFVUR_19250, partial [Stenotrophomonas bentonitica]
PLILLQVESWNGSLWTIHGPGAGTQGIVLDEDPEGLWETPSDTIWTEGAFQEGGTYGGVKHNMQDVVFNVHISSIPEAGVEWQTVFSQWKQAWDFEKQSYLVATTPSGIRRLALQKVSTPVFRPKHDPGINSYGLMTMTLRAAWPFWVEDDVVDVFQSKPANRVNLSTPITFPDGTSLSAVYRGTV